MSEFVRFRYHDRALLNALARVFDAIKAVKNNPGAGNDYDLAGLRAMLPEDVSRNFDWPERIEPQFDPSRPVVVARPGTYIGHRWNFGAVTELIEMGDYKLRECVAVDDKHAELRIQTFGYPYGGLNHFIALVEGFGFQVVGFNECGKYEAVDT